MSEASTATLRQMTQSRESSATVRAMSEALNSRDYSADAMDVDGPEIALPPTANVKKSTIIVATDFGTTFSSVAFAMRGTGRNPRVKMVANYPDDTRILQGRPNLEVPTESWYPHAAQLAELGSPDMDIASAEEQDLGSLDLYGASDSDEEENENQRRDDLTEESEAIPAGHPQNAPRNLLWGYEIHNMIITPEIDRKKFDRIARSKSLLDTGEYTQEVRTELQPVLNRLKRRRIIKDEVAVIADYLTQLFIHAKQQIQNSLEIYDSAVIEHVLCVPLVWSSKALRKMQLAMEYAVQKSDFGTMNNLFLVAEPEAAAAFVLDRSDEVNVTCNLLSNRVFVY